MNNRNTRVYLFSTAALLVLAGVIGAYVARHAASASESARQSGQNEASSKSSATGQTRTIDTPALFSDQGTLFFSPQEPTAADAVKVTLRAAANNLTSAKLVVIDTVTKHQTSIDMRQVGVGQNGEYAYWQATIPPSSHYENYYFVAHSGSNTAFYTGNGATTMLPDTGYFAVSPGFTTPKWAQNGVMYQIFVDRFYNGNPQNDVKTDAYTWYGSPTLQLKWGHDPELGDLGGRDQVAFAGGDLEGVQAKLPYLTKQLGVNVLYLNPVFTARTNHKYGVDNYFQVDPHFGGDQALQSLIQSAHQSGDKVILDGVFNHTGASNPWFQSAIKSKNSPYKNWYTFTQWPSQYATFAGVQNLPKLNFSNPAVVKEVDNVAKFWLSAPYGADGWRLDAAGHVGGNGNDPEAINDFTDPVNHAVWTSFRNAVKSVNPNAFVFGEFWQNSVALPWLEGGQWDGSINYGGFITPVSAWATGKDLSMNPATLSASDLSDTLFSSLNELPRPAQLVQVNQLGTHDTTRFGERAAKSITEKSYPGGQTFPYGGTPNYRKDALGAMLQMAYTGLPTIYYGDEYGMMGGGSNDPGKRWTFDWSKTGNDLFKVYQKLIAMRKSNTALVDGSFIPLLADDTHNVFGFARVDANDRTIVVLNPSDHPVTETVHAAAAGASPGSVFTNVTPLLPGVTGEGGSGPGGSATVDSHGDILVTIPANYGVIVTQAGGPLYTPANSGK